VVTYNSRQAVGRTLPALLGQLDESDELVVVDNASRDGTPEEVANLAPRARLIRNPANAGFASACNTGARATSGDLLVFLNPDALPAPGFCDAIRRPLESADHWDSWMGLVTLDGGRRINTSGGVVHFTGIAWAGQAGRAVEEAPGRPTDVGFASGACCAVPRPVWDRLGGFEERYFMYHEDVDLSLRIRLAGGRVGIEPRARVDHDYEFDKGGRKWRLLERNRWATLIRTYPAAVMATIAPALLATELALCLVSLRRGFAREKLAAAGETLRAMPRLLRERRAIQASRVVSAGEFASWLTPALSSEYLDAPCAQVVGPALRGYWHMAGRLLRTATPPR
jgi:GT2 family glycosyltransferase